MLIARREPGAKASFVDNSDRRRLGTTIPAMNKVNATSISSRASEKTFCLFMVFAFSFSYGPNRDTTPGPFADLQFGRRAMRTKSRSAETLALYAPMRAASTGKPSRSATRRLIPTSWSSERLNPTTGRTRFAPEREGATGLGGGRRRQRRCAISENCSQSCLSHIARPFLGEFDLDDEAAIYQCKRAAKHACRYVLSYLAESRLVVSKLRNSMLRLRMELAQLRQT
jgi:hypothetical protein